MGRGLVPTAGAGVWVPEPGRPAPDPALRAAHAGSPPAAHDPHGQLPVRRPAAAVPAGSGRQRARGGRPRSRRPVRGMPFLPDDESAPRVSDPGLGWEGAGHCRRRGRPQRHRPVRRQLGRATGHGRGLPGHRASNLGRDGATAAAAAGDGGPLRAAGGCGRRLSPR